ncbi:PmoA family protein [Verrucomicrobiaceae bacterium N1E253]|uniref:PmoA family protein n=1 Tax=Oceaniferula marina TaxID=2748318 RepID=A0A851GBX5_9BACT|nr:DUF6807 family protein [Oceaniferula marina]NWK54926.1 PmoA family protein [Oceaniferula marina]
MRSSSWSPLLLAVGTLTGHAQFEASQAQGKIEIRDRGKVVLAWQYEPIQQAKGGAKFAGSAFLHPITTPAGFELTRIQPGDHLHHFGLWWPWKMVQVQGKKYNTWEIQQKQGRHRCVQAGILNQSANKVSISFENHSEINTAAKGKAASYQPVIKETGNLTIQRQAGDSYIIDIRLNQKPIQGSQTSIAQYRYSGFSWRGTAAWNKTNSTLLSSGGHKRDQANGTTATWAMVYGDTEIHKQAGKATMLIMSAAKKLNHAEERLRVWDSKAHNGAPFINFNPVMKQPASFDANNSPVRSRHYRIIVADKVITPDEANQYWAQWKLLH